MQTLSQVMAPTPPPRVFVPVSNLGVQRPGMSSSQPPSPTQPAPVQLPVVPAAPPPTVQTVDTSNVPGNFLLSFDKHVQKITSQKLSSPVLYILYYYLHFSD